MHISARATDSDQISVCWGRLSWQRVHPKMHIYVLIMPWRFKNYQYVRFRPVILLRLQASTTGDCTVMKLKSRLSIRHWLCSSKGTVQFTTNPGLIWKKEMLRFFISVFRNVRNHLLCCIQNNDINTSSLISNSSAYKKFTCFDTVSGKHSVWSLHSSSVGLWL